MTTATTVLLAACGSSPGGVPAGELPTSATSTPAPGTGSGTTPSSGTGSGPSSGTSSGSGAVPTPASVASSVPGAGSTSTAGTGKTYDVAIVNPATGDTVGFTVFEPTNIAAGQTYPLVLHSHGYSASRTKSTTASSANAASPGNIPSLLAANYGVISISERGSDDSTGTIRIMDPDYEGKDLLAVMDWAEANLKWLRYGTGIDGSANNLVVGSIGGSYGGMYQYLINNIDPKHRLDASVAQIAPNDLTYSLFPNNTIKAGWDSALFGLGDTAGDPTAGGMKANTDPFVANFFAAGLSTNTISQDGRDFFYYHSNAYFCNGKTVAGNGTIGGTTGVQGSGTPLKPERAPVHAVKTNILFYQGMRDTLFNFNESYANYQCLKSGGGDVRLLSYQSGHNALQVIPDPGTVYQPPGNFLDTNCGAVNVDTATVAFFDEYLKGIVGAANKVVPTKTCLSLTKGDAILVDTVTTGMSGKEVDVPSTMVVSGGAIDTPTAIDLGITAAAMDVIGGIPHISLTVAKVNAALPGEPFLFVGIGQTRNGVPGVYDLIDNQVTPLRGVGSFDIDLIGVAERLAAGDKLYLLVYGQHDQYHVTGAVNAANPAVVPVTVAGKVWVPLLGNLPTFTTPS